jgi:Predicted acyl-CoA transferases/carnitine dehydratase
MLEEIFATKEVNYWVSLMWQNGIPAAPVYNLAQVFADPHIRHRKVVIETPSPFGPVKHLRSPINSQTLETGNYTAPPALGQHTEEILKELGYSDEEIEKMVATGVARRFKDVVKT